MSHCGENPVSVFTNLCKNLFCALKDFLYMPPVSHSTTQHIEGIQSMLNTSPMMLNVLSSLIYISVFFVGL